MVIMLDVNTTTNLEPIKFNCPCCNEELTIFSIIGKQENKSVKEKE